MTVQTINMNIRRTYDEVVSLMREPGTYELQFPSDFGPGSVYSFLERCDNGYAPMDILGAILSKMGFRAKFQSRLEPNDESDCDIVKVEIEETQTP